MPPHSRLAHYEIVRTLMRSSTATVKLARNVVTTELVALKVFKLSVQSHNSIRLMNTEVALLMRLSHDHIIQLYDNSGNAEYRKKSGESYRAGYLALELCSEGDLLDYCVGGGRFEEREVRGIVEQVTEAVEYAHYWGVAHRDIKPENLLLSCDFRLKLADFGSACDFHTDEGETCFVTGKVGTKSYAAPEVYTGQPYNAEKVDIFSLGVSMFCLSFRARPFDMATSNCPLFALFVNNNAKYWADMEQKQIIPSSDFIDLINKMLAVNPENRPNIDEIRSHSWMKAEKVSKEELSNVFRARLDAVRVSREQKRQQRSKKKAVLKGQNAIFRSLDSSGSSISDEEFDNLPRFCPVPSTLLAIFARSTAETLRKCIKSSFQSQFIISENQQKSRIRLRFSEDNREQSEFRISLYSDLDDVTVINLKKISGCEVTLFSLYQTLRAVIASLEVCN